MNSRMLHPGLLRNPSFRRLPIACRLAITSCITETDDFGRGFTTALCEIGGVPDEQLSQAMDAIEATGLMRFYGPDRRYFYYPGFAVVGDTFQKIEHPRKSNIPPPTDDPVYSESMAARIEELRRIRREGNERTQRCRERRRTAATVDVEPDPDDILSPPPAQAHAPEPISRRLGAPIELPVRLRSAYDEIVRAHGVTIAARALKAASRWFPMPSERQLAATLQAAAEEGLLESEPEHWPDFRQRMGEERAREINPAGVTASDADRAVYARIGKRVTSP